MRDAPWSEISMAAIASQAGVSRQTLYNEFGSRDSFAQTYALRAADRFLTDVLEAFTEHRDDPHRALRRGFEVFLELAAKDPMVRHIILRDQGSDELLALFTTRGKPIIDMATVRLRARILELWQQADPGDVQVLADGLVRLGIIHVGLPSSSTRQSADDVTALLTPFIDAHLPR